MIRTLFRAQAAALVAAFLLWASPAWSQAVLQGGPVSALGGHVPTYLPSGQGGLATVMDSGGAGGGPIGFGLSEKGLQARTPPGQGTGPLGAHDCDWDTYATNPAGANWFCVDADINGNAVIASKLPLQFNIGGQIVPFPAAQIVGNLYVSSNGSDVANDCSSKTAPCQTISHAVVVAANSRFSDSSLNDAQINVLTTGSYAGATIAGHFQNASGLNLEPCLTIAGTGDASSATPTHITNDQTGGNRVWDFEVSGNACVVLRNLDMVIGAGGIGAFTQDGGSHLFPAGTVSCTGPASGTEAQACMHTEGGAYIEVPGTGTKIIAQGKFAWEFTVGATPGKLTFDGGSGTFSCGTGLTFDANGGFFLEEGQSAVSIAPGWAWDSSCTGVVGHPAVLQNNSTLINNTGSPLPNVGSWRIFDNSVVMPNPTPGTTTCPNGAVVNTGGVNPSNNAFQLTFTGANTQCQVEFGSFLTNQFWFTNTPNCTATIQQGSIPITKFIGLTYVLNGVAITPSSAFGSGDGVTVNCSAPPQG